MADDTRYFPSYVRVYGEPDDTPPAWRICFDSDEVGHDDTVQWLFGAKFAREQDAAMACRTLQQSKYTLTDLESMDDEPFLQLIYEHLAW